jgi:SAM-dependent methyltransferase
MTASSIEAADPQDLISQETVQNLVALPKGPTYLEEAEFGLRRILPVLEALPAGARVLEVGSGPCIVLSEISIRFPQLHLEGIEPMGDGFAYFRRFISRARAARRFEIYEGGYETFPSTEPWDLIFLVNVFEHLPDWRDFLDFVSQRLSEKGRCIILCPNYGFPYESHFRLPVIWNKAMTQRAFRKRIESFEQNNDNDGLYRSLNFVTLRQVRKAAPRAGLAMKVNTDIIIEMVERLDKDPEFARRQRVLAVPARLLHRSGLLEMMAEREFIQNHLPYMQIELERTSAP